MYSISVIKLHYIFITTHNFRSSGKSPGNPVVELAPPNGTNNLTEGTKKNGLMV